MTLSGVTTPNNARFNGGGTLTLCEGVTLGNRTTISNSIENNTLHNNTHIKHKPQNELIIETTNFTAGETATITASIYYTTQVNTNITKGKVTFKVNGKTLKDSSGKVIYAKVVNGTATIENYEIPSDWAKDGSTIEAVYLTKAISYKIIHYKCE
ncbi:MAG: hypothetical protein IJJ47_00575 [Methanosphaera sp.]|nr:hypothetical protein [Methanosphaera sp.]